MSFKEKVQSLTESDMLQHISSGLRKQWIPITIGEGMSSRENGVVFETFAYNVICDIAGKIFDVENLRRECDLVDNTDAHFVRHLRDALHLLRAGDVEGYNIYARYGGFSSLSAWNLPRLHAHTYADYLQ